MPVGVFSIMNHFVMQEKTLMKRKRTLMSVLGVIITAVSVGAFKLAAFGVDPFQVFMSGFDVCFPIGFGTLYVIVNAFLLLFALVFDRHYIGIATFINLFLLGYIVEFSLGVLQMLFPDAGILVRAMAFGLGFVFLCLGSSLYMSADLGVSTYDAIAIICANTWKLGKFKYIRICTDLVCIVLGVGMHLLSGAAMGSLGALVGVGTMITALGMGPLIDWLNRKFSLPLLRR